MDETDRAFRKVSSLLGENDLEAAYVEIERIINSSRDRPFTLVKCAGLLLTIDCHERSSEVADLALGSMPESEGERLQMAIAMRGLGRFDDALDILNGMDGDDIVAERARNLLGLGDAEGALSLLHPEWRGMDGLRSEALSLAGEHEEAISLARSVVSRDLNYDTGHTLLGAMLRAGDVKGAKRFANNLVKEGKNPDSLALKSFVMRINGRIPAAMNYANQALIKEPRHIGALWNLALCLLERGRQREAKVLAGAINEVSPADPKALEIVELTNG